MLMVRIELWPGGNRQAATEIGRMAIANISDLAETSDYRVKARDDHGEVEVQVRGHLRSSGFWWLMAMAAVEVVKVRLDGVLEDDVDGGPR